MTVQAGAVARTWGKRMRTLILAATAGALALGLSLAPAAAQAAGGGARPYTVKLVNSDSQSITSIYASAPGKNDWGDDLLGKQSAGAGKTVTLTFKNVGPDACMQDLQMLMNDGKVVEKGKVDVCNTPEYRFSR